MLENFKKLPENYQSSIVQGIDAFFAFQKQLVENTFDVYEKGLQLRETGYSKTKAQVQEISTVLEKQINGNQEKVKSALTSLTEKYVPQSKEKVLGLQQVVQENLEKIVAQLRTILQDNVDQSVQKVLKQEKQLLSKVRDVFQGNLKVYHTQVHALLGVQAPAKPAEVTEAPKAAKKPATAKKTATAKPAA